MKKDARQGLAELEQLTDEIRVKLHLANMDAKDAWRTRWEPRLLQVRRQAREATASSAHVLEDLIQALREFRGGLGG